jgi:hypothetical protein
MTADATTTYNFPHPSLTTVEGKPTATSLLRLRKEIYANARSVHSDLGGGSNGYLGLVMPSVQYTLRTMIPFTAPVHPGALPVHAQGTTGPVITARDRLYDKRDRNYKEYLTVLEALRSLLMQAVERTYYQVLEDPLFGMSDVSPRGILDHLASTYGTLTPADILKNQAKLAEAWNAESPIEDLWKKIDNVHAVATAASPDISEGTTIELTLLALKAAGVYDHLLTTWSNKPKANRTYANFKAHVNLQDDARLEKLTAHMAGFHAANRAVAPAPAVLPVPPAPAVAIAGQAIIAGDIHIKYCHTHGFQKSHGSDGCQQPRAKHNVKATAMKRLGGSTTIGFDKQGRRQE